MESNVEILELDAFFLIHAEQERDGEKLLKAGSPRFFVDVCRDVPAFQCREPWQFAASECTKQTSAEGGFTFKFHQIGAQSLTCRGVSQHLQVL